MTPECESQVSEVGLCLCTRLQSAWPLLLFCPLNISYVCQLRVFFEIVRGEADPCALKRSTDLGILIMGLTLAHATVL